MSTADRPPYADLDLSHGAAALPPGALCLEAGPVQLEQAEPADDGNIPVTILARSPKPVDHWFWGKVVHDLEGCQHKPRIPLDYNHLREEILGYANDFRTGPNGLVLSGALTPIDAADRATEVYTKAGRGVPYEASISFSGPLVLEEVGEGATVKVNGYSLTGPALVIRQWTLRGCAICPYGMDRDTATKFYDAGPETVPVQLIQHEETSSMFGKKEEATTDPDRQAVKQFTDLFGPEKGTEWYTAGKTLDEARELHRQELAARVEELEEANGEQGASLADLTKERDALKAKAEKLEADLAAATKERDALKARIDSAELGEATPVSGKPEATEAQKWAEEKAPQLGEARASIAGKIRQSRLGQN